MATITPILVKPIELLLPAHTEVHIRAYTNAGYKQRIALQLPGVNPIVWEGNGEHDHLIGERFFSTPAAGPALVKVVIENDGGTGNFHPSKMMKIGCNLQTFNMAAVLSEDAGDQDYNDAVVEFTWWTRI